MTGDDNPFPDESEVTVRYPAPGQTAADPREDWPWWPGVVEQRCGEDEWLVTVCADELAAVEDGTTWYPQCFRDQSEILRAGYRAGAPSTEGAP